MSLGSDPATIWEWEAPIHQMRLTYRHQHDSYVGLMDRPGQRVLHKALRALSQEPRGRYLPLGGAFGSHVGQATGLFNGNNGGDRCCRKSHESLHAKADLPASDTYIHPDAYFQQVRQTLLARSSAQPSTTDCWKACGLANRPRRSSGPSPTRNGLLGAGG